MGKCFRDGFTFPNCASRVLLSSPTLEMTILNSSTALQFSAMLVFLIRKVSLRSPTCNCLNLEKIFDPGTSDCYWTTQLFEHDCCRMLTMTLNMTVLKKRLLMLKLLLTSSLRFRSLPLASLQHFVVNFPCITLANILQYPDACTWSNNIFIAYDTSPLINCYIWYDLNVDLNDLSWQW